MFDNPILEPYRYALHRSRIRIGILLALLKLAAPATTAELARLVRTDGRAIRGALYGRMDSRSYRIVDALIVLGLVVALADHDRVVYALTSEGMRVARALQLETLVELGRRPRLRV